MSGDADPFHPALSAAGVAAWLEARGLSDAAAAVRTHGLDGADLAHCEPDDFDVIGISPSDVSIIQVRAKKIYVPCNWNPHHHLHHLLLTLPFLTALPGGAGETVCMHYIAYLPSRSFPFLARVPRCG